MEVTREFIEKLVDFYRCPNSNRVIEGMKGDDKIICSCKKASPGADQRGAREAVTGSVVHHIRALLPSATYEEWEQEERTRIAEER